MIRCFHNHEQFILLTLIYVSDIYLQQKKKIYYVCIYI